MVQPSHFMGDTVSQGFFASTFALGWCFEIFSPGKVSFWPVTSGKKGQSFGEPRKVSPVCIVENSWTNIHLWKEFNRRAMVVRRMGNMSTEGITLFCFHLEELLLTLVMDWMVGGRMWCKPLAGWSCSHTNCSQTGSHLSSISHHPDEPYVSPIRTIQTITHHAFALSLCKNLACRK